MSECELPPFPTDKALCDWITQTLYVPLICDALDLLGWRQQAMHQRLRPLHVDQSSFAGRARTFHWMDTDYVNEQDPYGLEIEAMDALQTGDVAVHSTDAAGTNAPWGELMTTIAKRNGAVGCVCDSNIRDCRRIMAMQFPVFYAGIRPLDSIGRGRVMAYDVPARCGDVLIHPGDLVVADYDGIAVLPKQVESEALAVAYEKLSKENRSRADLLRVDTLRTVFDRHGVL